MLHVVLAALILTWKGIGLTEPPPVVPVIVANAGGGRLPAVPVVLHAYEGRERVSPDYTATPDGAIIFSTTDRTGTFHDLFALPGKYRGPAMIHARYGNDSDTLQAFVYDSAGVSCAVLSGGVRFNVRGVAESAGTPQESDMYQTGPANNAPTPSLPGCREPFLDSSQSDTLHVPYGGTVVHETYFGDVGIRAWRNDFTIVPELTVGDALLFKTRDGSIVKLLVYPFSGEGLSGAYITASPSGDFLDYVTRHSKEK